MGCLYRRSRCILLVYRGYCGAILTQHQLLRTGYGREQLEMELINQVCYYVLMRLWTREDH